MASIQQIVNRELERRPAFLELFHQGLGNVSAVAEILKKPVEAEFGKRVKAAAIGMAIRRYLAEDSPGGKLNWKFPSDLEVSTKSKIYEVAIERPQDSHKLMGVLAKKINRDKGDLLSIVEGSYETVFFTNQKHKPTVRTALKGHKITSELDNIAYITVNWEKVTKDIPGIYYRITRALAYRGLSIQSFHTIGAEMMICFKEDAFLEAYQTMAGLLANQLEI